MVLWREKIWYFGEENCSTVGKNYGILIHYEKNYGTIVNYS